MLCFKKTHDQWFEAHVSGKAHKLCKDFLIPHIYDIPYEDTGSLENMQQSKMKRLFFENYYENLLEKYKVFDINYNMKRKTQKLCANQVERLCHMIDSKCKKTN